VHEVDIEAVRMAMFAHSGVKAVTVISCGAASSLPIIGALQERW